MLNDTVSRETVHRILDNFDLKIVLDSPKGDYRFQYFTSPAVDRVTGNPQLRRTYKLLDIQRGAVTPEPWGAYDLAKQTTLVANLINVANYRFSKVIAGWQVTCPGCGHIQRGKSWETVPGTCVSRTPTKCRTKIEEINRKEIPFEEI